MRLAVVARASAKQIVFCADCVRPGPLIGDCLIRGPADLLGLPVGRLAKGAAADLVLFDLDRPWQIEEPKLHSKSKNSPFDGRPVQGRVLLTVVDGRTVYRDEG